jgi:hypothetical protein
MKTSNIAVVIGTLFSILTETASAQILTAGSFVASKETTSFTSEANASSNKREAKLSKANFRAAKNLSRQFKGQSDVKWLAEEKVISASFKKDGVQTYSVFDKNGHWVRNMMIYAGDKMPADILSLVKSSEYKHYDITQVQELQERGGTFYIVHIEDAKGYKKLCVFDNTITVHQEYRKQ